MKKLKYANGKPDIDINDLMSDDEKQKVSDWLEGGEGGELDLGIVTIAPDHPTYLALERLSHERKGGEA